MNTTAGNASSRSMDMSSDLNSAVRLCDAECIITGDNTLQLGSKEKKPLRTKEPLVFWDLGERLVTAKSVNDLLEAFYDALEGTTSTTCSILLP